MDTHENTCETLVEKCKQEAKLLVEYNFARKLHWAHPSFISFCVSVDDILSFGVKRQYQSSKSQQVTTSGKVLRDVGKTLLQAATVYAKCYGGAEVIPQDEYATVQNASPAERKVFWIRVALMEGKLQPIIEEIMKNPRQYYLKESVLCHPVYGEIFSYLLDGPCSLKFSRLRTPDYSTINPSPSEIVKRHQKYFPDPHRILSISVSKSQQAQEAQSTEEAWDYVRSLYQNHAYTTLFGKNNILMKPPGLPEPVKGYFSLQLKGTSLVLKWIPNFLLNESMDSSNSSLWEHVLNVDIEMVAHIHCHRSPDRSEMILIGYDGIAHPPIVFPHQPSLFHFLACLENSILPRGSLEPPLWYLKTQTAKWKKETDHSPTLDKGFDICTVCDSVSTCDGSVTEEGDGEQWWEGVEVWNQVFRLRCGGGREQEAPALQSVINAPLPVNLRDYSYSIEDESDTSPDTSSECGSDSEPLINVNKPGSLARKDWEKFQIKVSKQLLARYFYSWLSYCRHMTRIHEKVAHMVGTRVVTTADRQHTQALGDDLWNEFEQNRNGRWSEILRVIYLKGVQHQLRTKVWPCLLGLYPPDSSEEERVIIDQQCSAAYSRVLTSWKQVEQIHKEMMRGVRDGSSSEESIPEQSKGHSGIHGGFESPSVARKPRPRDIDGVLSSRSNSPTLSVLSESDVSHSGRASPALSIGDSISPEPIAVSTALEPIAVSGEGSTALEPIAVSGEGSTVPKPIAVSGEGSAAPKPVAVSGEGSTVPKQIAVSGEGSTVLEPIAVSGEGSAAPKPVAVSGEGSTVPKPVAVSAAPKPVAVSGEGSTVLEPIAVSGEGSTVPKPIAVSGEDSTVLKPIAVITPPEQQSSVLHTSSVPRGSLTSQEHKDVTNGLKSQLPLTNGGSPPRIDHVNAGVQLEADGLSKSALEFIEELDKIDKDVPRCDRDFWFFQDPSNLDKLRNIISSYVWTHMKDGYSQGMCDLLAPLLVVFQDEATTYACFLRVMAYAQALFPPSNGMNSKLANLQALLQVLEPDFFQYLTDMGDGLFYCYRWFLVAFKREFDYSDIFRLWETIWAARQCASNNFEEFIALAILQQFMSAIMDARLDTSDIINLFTDTLHIPLLNLAEKRAIDCSVTIALAQSTIEHIQTDLTTKDD